MCLFSGEFSNHPHKQELNTARWQGQNETAEERMWSQSSSWSEKQRSSNLYRNLHITPARLQLHAHAGLHVSAHTSVATGATLATFHNRA